LLSAMAAATAAAAVAAENELGRMKKGRNKN
jgi:hypothetical protein